jgi:hypothetical protein
MSSNLVNQTNKFLLSIVICLILGPWHGVSAQIGPVVVTGQRPGPSAPNSGGNTCDMSPSCSRGGRSAAQDEAAMEAQLNRYLELAANENRPPEDAKCLKEQFAMDTAMADARRPDVLSGQANPVSRVIKTTQEIARGNPADRYSTGAWEKRQLTFPWTNTIIGPPVRTENGNIVIHYMFNVFTRESEQYKFKNTVQQGCGSSAPAVGVSP